MEIPISTRLIMKEIEEMKENLFNDEVVTRECITIAMVDKYIDACNNFSWIKMTVKPSEIYHPIDNKLAPGYMITFTLSDEVKTMRAIQDQSGDVVSKTTCVTQSECKDLATPNPPDDKSITTKQSSVVVKSIGSVSEELYDNDFIITSDDIDEKIKFIKKQLLKTHSVVKRCYTDIANNYREKCIKDNILNISWDFDDASTKVRGKIVLVLCFSWHHELEFKIKTIIEDVKDGKPHLYCIGLYNICQDPVLSQILEARYPKLLIKTSAMWFSVRDPTILPDIPVKIDIKEKLLDTPKPDTRNRVSPAEFHKKMEELQLDFILEHTVKVEAFDVSTRDWPYGFITNKNRKILKQYGYVIEQKNSKNVSASYQGY